MALLPQDTKYSFHYPQRKLAVLSYTAKERIAIMSIRNAAKAIILHSGKILLNRCQTPYVGDFFTLPGGGQNQYETMEEAIVRECLEETGYTVIPETFIALYEEIYTCESLREKYPDYSHKILHIFKCSLTDELKIIPIEQDYGQLDCAWVDLKDLTSIKLLPAIIGDNIQLLLDSKSPLYLGSHYIDLENSV